MSTVVVLLAGREQQPPPGTGGAFPADPSLGDLLASWDGGWYAGVAETGYPTELPRVGGDVVQNPWAFYPLLPTLARTLMLAGLDFVWAASAVALAASAAACVLLFAMVRERTDDFTGSLAVATLTLGPVGLVFHASYTEGPALLLVLLALRALGSRQWGRLACCGLLLALTRPVVLPLAAVCAVAWVALWWRRDIVPFPLHDRVRLGVATVVVAASYLAWPVAAGMVTGEADAYLLTQRAWLDTGAEWTTWISAVAGKGEPAFAGIAVVLLLVVGATVRGARRAWPREGRWWAVLYVLYVLGATRPTSSVLRYLVLAAFPTWPLPELSRRCRTTRTRTILAVPVIALCCVAQWWWTSTIWVTHGDRSSWP